MLAYCELYPTCADNCCCATATFGGSNSYQGKHALNTLLHISSREGYWRMVTTIFDDRTRIPADRDVPILVDARNQRGRTPLHVRIK